MVAGGSLMLLRLVPRATAFVLLTFGGGALEAQTAGADPNQVQDARGLLEYHLAVSTQPLHERALEANTLERAFVYLRAGAEGELRGEIQNLTEDHPDALRFAMLADCWNPTHFPDGLHRAQDWLQRFSNRTAAEVSQVEAIQGFLQEASTRRSSLLDQRSSGSWYPYGAVIGAALLALAVARFMP